MFQKQWLERGFRTPHHEEATCPKWQMHQLLWSNHCLRVSKWHTVSLKYYRPINNAKDYHNYLAEINIHDVYEGHAARNKCRSCQNSSI